MAYSKVVLTFNSIPNINDFLHIREDTVGINLNESFVANRTYTAQVTIPSTIPATVLNYKNAFNIDYNSTSLFTLDIVGNVLTITATYDNAVFVETDNYAPITVNITNEVVYGGGIEIPNLPNVILEDRAVLSRSPFFISVTPLVAFDEIRANLYIYRGDKVFDKPIIQSFSLSKKIVLALQPKISFDIHKIVNDYVKNNYSAILGIGANTTSTLDTVWCYVDAEIYSNFTFKYRILQQLLIVDGFGYTTELANPVINKKVLSSINNHVIYSGGDYPLYFITKDLTSIIVNGNSIPFTYNQDFNNQNIGYVNISDYATVSNFNAIFVYTDETVTHSFALKEECRFTNINCIFKNKFGFWQTIPFNKLSKKTIDFESQDYSGLIAQYGEYNLSQHEKKSFLSNGKEKITVNTDFINENYNALFVELMLSEFIYLEENGEVLPVNLLKKSFEKKTKLNNKLIQYSMDFEYSFKLMNTIL